ncbi:MAG: UPF0262 family protein [Pseudomonadota bacterium]|nr:UPF0262 family protein [Pseudomonadota bacterium]
MSASNKNYIKKIDLITSPHESIVEFVSYERQAAIHDLINENKFSIKEANIFGPFKVKIEITDNVLNLKISSESNVFSKNYRVPINSLKKIVKTYHSACNLYFESIRQGSLEKIEDIEKNRRDIHNDGANQLIKLTEKDFNIDHNTSRRLFTLLYSLYI